MSNKMCIIPGCKNKRMPISMTAHSIKCVEHQKICPHCKEREGNGDWNMGYCQECQPLLLACTITLPLGVDDGKLSDAEIALMLKEKDD